MGGSKLMVAILLLAGPSKVNNFAKSESVDAQHACLLAV
jgi:hypothetical protein